VNETDQQAVAINLS